MSYEYRVIPAPVKGTKAKGVKTAQDRFALSLQEVMNRMAADGWEFQRAEALPAEERAGLTGTKVVTQHMLVFRRTRATDLAAFQPRLLDTAGADTPAPQAPQPAPAVAIQPDKDAPQRPRIALFAKSDVPGNAPPVPSPQDLSRSLKTDTSDTPRD